jgi:hypothetical protein
MSRWFRFYTGAVDDAKVQMLAPELFKHWVNVLCIAAQHDGELPSISVTAFTLRLPEAKTASILAKLHSLGLLDKTEKSFKPHNWDSRQYKHDKNDPTNAERQQRYRDKHNAKGNAKSNGVTAVTDKRPEGTECSDNSEPIGSGPADADPRDRLFKEGLTKLAELTGKGPDSCRSFAGQCLKVAKDDASVVLGAIDDAHRNRVADAGAWIMARLRAKPVDRVAEVDWDAVLSAYKKTGHWSRFAGNDPTSPGCRAPQDLLLKYGLRTMQ